LLEEKSWTAQRRLVNGAGTGLVETTSPVVDSAENADRPN
jgi:hypothetical protein